MAIRAYQGDISQRPSYKDRLTHNVGIQQSGLMITRLMDAVNHQTPNDKQWLSYQTGETISYGQATQQNIARSLQGRRLDNSYNDCQVCKNGEDAERYVDDTNDNVIDEESVVNFSLKRVRQTTDCASILTFSHHSKPK